jgi:phage shock protein A
MTQEEFDKNKFAAQRVVAVADELIKKLETNDRTIAERRVMTTATSNLSREFISVLNQILGEMKSTSIEDPLVRLENLSNVVASVVSQLEENLRSSNDEVVRLEATQDGMRRALQAVRDSGALQERELEKISALAESENPEARRKVGEHPESFSTKRNASSLKKSRESSNT